ncbi:glutamine synthetase [candidate division SR1 bacterium]|nr:glutamine synthetase [candidate division SR1 bacterium]
MSNYRFNAVERAVQHQPISGIPPHKKMFNNFAENVFTPDKMKKYLQGLQYDNSPETAEKILLDIQQGKKLDKTQADIVAKTMLSWATDNGASHYTHWFQPLTDGTAEKHDTFANLQTDSQMVNTFTGKKLIQQEPDASSFPNGGMRSTFEARGYTAWDPSSPVFIIGDTLYIPSVFISYAGEALDYKYPLLKSLKAIDQAATAVCQLFDPEIQKVESYLGVEQEFFLVDNALFTARPELKQTGRTLTGHQSAKNQQLEDQYFGSISPRVLSFMQEVEYEAHKLGIPLQTRHNEVAPNQFEFAPRYENVNIANDHNQLLMSMMKRVAGKHNFNVLFHEKPFKGSNGSGKHCNWSLGTDTGINLLKPGKNADENLRFIVFIVNIIQAVHQHNALLKASIASAKNAHRLGGFEAPPAIISIFLGSMLTQVLEQIEKGKTLDNITFTGKHGRQLSLASIPEILVDNTDRNRTSPFAFVGDRFEFRAVGSSANCASPMIVLSSIVAHQLTKFKQEVDKLTFKGMDQHSAIYTVLKRYIKQSKNVRFDGDNYSENWMIEAKQRGLDCEISVPRIIDAYLSESSITMFESMNVFTRAELLARNEIKWDMYVKNIQIESLCLQDIATKQVKPVVIDYQNILLENRQRLISLRNSVHGVEKQTTLNMNSIKKLSTHLCDIESQISEMIEKRHEANEITDTRERAIAYSEGIFPYLSTIRHHIDELEQIIPDDKWPLIMYRELLFTR